MYNFLEKFLGDSTRALWESYKQKFPNSFQADLQLGTNPYNFTNKITMLVLNAHPNVGQDLALQMDAMRTLEQLQLKDWRNVKKFLNDFFFYCNMAGCYYETSIADKLFLKLPGPLGQEIYKEFKENESFLVLESNNLGTRVLFVFKNLVEKCINIKITIQ